MKNKSLGLNKAFIATLLGMAVILCAVNLYFSKFSTESLLISFLLLTCTVFSLIIFHYSRLMKNSEKQSSESEKPTIDIAAQVVHDLGSPIVALEMVLKDVSNLPEEKVKLITTATKKLTQISTSLLKNQRKSSILSKATSQKSAKDYLTTKVENQFSDNIRLKERILVVDDDSLIHDVWKSRFDGIDGISEVKYFSSTFDFFQWQELSCDSLQNYTLLIDYEFTSNEPNGIQLIDHLNVMNSAYLVTNRYSQEEIQRECKEKCIRLVPKAYISFIELSPPVLDSENTVHVLIDDDELVHQSWKLAAALKGINLKTFHSVSDFYHADFDPTEEIKIYIDSDLGDGQRGELLAKDIKLKGFNEIHLTTGFDLSLIQMNESISSVIEKSPPWS